MVGEVIALLEPFQETAMHVSCLHCLIHYSHLSISPISFSVIFYQYFMHTLLT